MSQGGQWSNTESSLAWTAIFPWTSHISVGSYITRKGMKFSEYFTLPRNMRWFTNLLEKPRWESDGQVVSVRAWWARGPKIEFHRYTLIFQPIYELCKIIHMLPSPPIERLRSKGAPAVLEAPWESLPVLQAAHRKSHICLLVASYAYSFPSNMETVFPAGSAVCVPPNTHNWSHHYAASSSQRPTVFTLNLLSLFDW